MRPPLYSILCCGFHGYLVFPQSYYYNLKTRETTWTKPEDVKIISQPEVDTLSNTPSAAADEDKSGKSSGMFDNRHGVELKYKIMILRHEGPLLALDLWVLQ